MSGYIVKVIRPRDLFPSDVFIWYENMHVVWKLSSHYFFKYFNLSTLLVFDITMEYLYTQCVPCEPNS